jgi:hypothetical protein
MNLHITFKAHNFERGPIPGVLKLHISFVMKKLNIYLRLFEILLDRMEVGETAS